MDVVSLSIDKTIAEAITFHAAGEFPFECCGVLVGTNHGGSCEVTRLIHAVNVAEGDRRRNYQIDWSTLFRVTRQTRGAGESIVGFYHSHPDGSARPSRRDLAEAWDDTVYVIVPVSAVSTGKPSAWIKPAGAVDFQSVPLVDRSHVPDRDRLMRSASARLEPTRVSVHPSARSILAARSGRPGDAGGVMDSDRPGDR